jgi:hypothetical protein
MTVIYGDEKGKKPVVLESTSPTMAARCFESKVNYLFFYYQGQHSFDKIYFISTIVKEK